MKSSSDDTPVRCPHRVATQPRIATITSPNSVPSNAVVVRAEKPWAAYRVTNMMADEPISPTAIGFVPTTSAGNMNLIKMKPAKTSPSSAANPRQRATAITATANRIAMTANGERRSKSENWYCAGCPSVGGIRTSTTF